MKIAFEDLLYVQTIIDEKLVGDHITLTEYNVTWKRLLNACGYTHDEYVKLVDERWERLEHINIRLFDARLLN